MITVTHERDSLGDYVWAHGPELDKLLDMQCYRRFGLMCDYACGRVPPRYPVPALFVDSMSDLGERWSQWVDDCAMYGKRF